MNKETISLRQTIYCVMLFIFGSSIILGVSGTAGQDAWISLLLATAGAFPLFMMYARIIRLYPETDFFDILTTIFGNIIGKVIIGLFTWYCIHLAFPIVTIVILLTVILAVNDMDLTNLLPVLEKGWNPVAEGAYQILTFPYGETVIFLCIAGSIKKQDSPYKIYGYSLLAGSGLLMLIILRNIAVLGPMMVGITYFPSYTTARILRLGEFLSRIEGMITMNFLLSGIVKITVCLIAGAKGISKLFNISVYRNMLMPTSMLALALCAIVYKSAMEMFGFLKYYPPWLTFANKRSIMSSRGGDSLETVKAKQLLTPLAPTDYFFHSDYNLNLYRGCSHGCIYCDSRSVCYQLDRFHEVRVKESALQILREELRCKRKSGLVSTGAMSDPYNPFEKNMEVTRGAFMLLRQFGFGAGFTTKSDLAARDTDVLADIQRSAPVRACFSITCMDDALCAKIEPYAAVTTRRFEALQAFSQAGIFAGVWLNPVLPFLTDNEQNILDIVRRTKECGGQFIVCHFGMTLRTGNREYFYQALDRDFPGIKIKYAQAFGLDYMCPSPREESLKAAFEEECVRLKIPFKFQDINRVMFSKQTEQLSLFA